MIASEFESRLVVFGFYFENPSLFVPGTDKDAEYYNADQLMDILSHEATADDPTAGFRRMVRKRAESAGSFTYYFKDDMGTEFFKVTVPTGTGFTTGKNQIAHTLNQLINTFKVRMGLF